MAGLDPMADGAPSPRLVYEQPASHEISEALSMINKNLARDEKIDAGVRGTAPYSSELPEGDETSLPADEFVVFRTHSLEGEAVMSSRESRTRRPIFSTHLINIATGPIPETPMNLRLGLISATKTPARLLCGTPAKRPSNTSNSAGSSTAELRLGTRSLISIRPPTNFTGSR